MNLRKSVKVMCAMHDKQQKELAESIGVTNVYLSKMLGDNNPKMLSKMADFFCVTVSEFVRAGE